MGKFDLRNLGSGGSVVSVVWLISSYFVVYSTAGKMGQQDSMYLKESVIRNHNGVMVMTLSPSNRRTVLSLSNTRQKPTVIFAPKRDKNDLLENQTETEANLPNSSGFFNSLGGNHEKEPTIKQKKLLKSHSVEQQYSTEEQQNGVASLGDFDNENESQLVEQSALRNASASISASKKKDLEDDGGSGGVVDVSSEENDFHAMIAGFLKREIWTIPLFVFASLNIVLITFFEIYVLCRTKGQSRGHLFLGQILLFGLFLCSTLALLFALYPSTIGCLVSRIGVGLSYSLIFAVLMVKCVFLLSLDVGVYLPTSYQSCLLLFAVLVQVALDTQWTILSPPIFQETEAIKEESLFLQCGTSYAQLLYSLAYVGFLMIFVGFLAAKATYRGITENYRESIYILMSVIVSLPISVSWILAGWILEGRHQDACVAFGLVAQSLTVFLIMFMPKGRQLAAMGKECAYEEEDQFSRYSPSFFHFKPSNNKSCKTAIFGDGNLYTTLEPTLSTINPNVFFHRADYHSGMIY